MLDSDSSDCIGSAAASRCRPYSARTARRRAIAGIDEQHQRDRSQRFVHGDLVYDRP